MNWRDVAAAGAVAHKLAGYDKAAGVLKSLGQAGWRGAQGALRLTAEKPMLAASALGTGALGTHIGHKGLAAYLEEMRKAKPAFQRSTIRGGLF